VQDLTGRAISDGLSDVPKTHSNCFRVGGVSVEVFGTSLHDVTLVSPLARFQVDGGLSDINIQVIRVREIHSEHRRELFNSGSVWRLYEGEVDLQFDFSTPVLGDFPYKRLTVDNRFRRASLLLSQRCSSQHDIADPLEYPLDELLIMHRLTQEQAIELHGVGIVGPDGASNLFVGHSGAGKSTTARLWTSLHEVEILSDDRIIVREHDDEIFMYGTPWHGEAHFALPQRAPLQRIFVLEHGHGNVITRLTRSQMVAELFARSFVPFHRHEYVDHALSFLERLADSVPCYVYSFEPDERAVEKIIHFHD
jgi:hypothetical protein